VRPRLSSDALLLSLLLLVTLVIAVFAVRSSRSQQRGDEFPPRRTSYSPGRGGYQAVYEALERLDYPVHRWRLSLDHLSEPGTLIIASPESALTTAEWRGLVQWVQQGNLLVLLTDQGHLFRQETSYPEIRAAAPRPSRLAQPTPLAATARELRTQAAFRLDATPSTRTSLAVQPVSGAQALSATPLAPLYRDDSGVTVAYTTWGSGRVIVSSSPWSLSTVGVGQADNFAWLLATLHAYAPGEGVQAFRRSGVQDGLHRTRERPNARTPERLNARLAPIWFDEYHHGYGQREGILSLLAPVARLGLAQLAVAWLMLAYAVSRRFGGSVPDEGRVRRSRSEYLGGMSSLLGRARAIDLAVAQVRRQFTSDAVRVLGLPRDVQEPVLIAAAAARGIDAERLQSLLQRADAVTRSHDRKHQAEAFAIARELAQLRKELSSPGGIPPPLASTTATTAGTGYRPVSSDS
jgi:hypothetical protein